MKDNSEGAKIKVDKIADANIAGSGEVQGSVQMQRICAFQKCLCNKELCIPTKCGHH